MRHDRRPAGYILDDENRPVPVYDMLELAHWQIANEHRFRIAEATIGPYWISTVFLCVGKDWHAGPPLVFETMVFLRDAAPIEGRAGEDMEQTRYSSFSDAEAGHAAAVRRWQKIVDEAKSEAKP